MSLSSYGIMPGSNSSVSFSEIRDSHNSQYPRDSYTKRHQLTEVSLGSLRAKAFTMASSDGIDRVPISGYISIKDHFKARQWKDMTTAAMVKPGVSKINNQTTSRFWLTNPSGRGDLMDPWEYKSQSYGSSYENSTHYLTIKTVSTNSGSSGDGYIWVSGRGSAADGDTMRIYINGTVDWEVTGGGQSQRYDLKRFRCFDGFTLKFEYVRGGNTEAFPQRLFVDIFTSSLDEPNPEGNRRTLEHALRKNPDGVDGS